MNDHDLAAVAAAAAGRVLQACASLGCPPLQPVEVDKARRRSLNGHGSAVVWLTGLSGAGKSTLARALELRLHARGVRSYVLDGDALRQGLNRDLGYSVGDRAENVRRVAEVAKLMVDAGVLVIAALISPFRRERQLARALFEANEFVEVFVDVPLAVAEGRDPKRLYERARRGEIKHFTGIDSPYKRPFAPDVAIDATLQTPDQAADHVCQCLCDRGLL